MRTLYKAMIALKCVPAQVCALNTVKSWYLHILCGI